MKSPNNAKSTINDSELAHFAAIAAEWWDENGKFRPLHRFNPVRLSYIIAKLHRFFPPPVVGFEQQSAAGVGSVGASAAGPISGGSASAEPRVAGPGPAGSSPAGPSSADQSLLGPISIGSTSAGPGSQEPSAVASGPAGAGSLCLGSAELGSGMSASVGSGRAGPGWQAAPAVASASVRSSSPDATPAGPGAAEAISPGPGAGGKPLSHISVIDIGCGGGLLAEPLARLGAHVVAIDATEQNIAIARHHSAQMGLEIDYRIATAEQIAQSGERYDVVLNMEVIEHVDNVDFFMESCAKLLKPQGLMFLSTINRNWKAFALAIIGAEYILRWLPRGTHSYNKFLTPLEVKEKAQKLGLRLLDEQGVVYNPLKDSWSLSADMDVNYMLLFGRS